MEQTMVRERKYPQHPEKKMTIISKSTKPRKGGHWREVVYKYPDGVKTNGKPAFASRTFHERIS